MINDHILAALRAEGFNLQRLGGRPPKTARDMAVMMALEWFKARASATGRRTKLRQAVVDLWQKQSHPGITAPEHVGARIDKAKKIIQSDFPDSVLIVRMGEGTTQRHVGPGARVFLIAGRDCTMSAGELRFSGRIGYWAFGDETAQEFEGEGVLAL